MNYLICLVRGRANTPTWWGTPHMLPMASPELLVLSTTLKRAWISRRLPPRLKKFLFDYMDLTAFERKVMKRVFPFYTWLRKNIPLQISMLLKSPRTYARINDTQNYIAGGPIDWDSKPEYIRDSMAIQPQGSDKYVNLNLYPLPILAGSPQTWTLWVILCLARPPAADPHWVYYQPRLVHRKSLKAMRVSKRLQYFSIRWPRCSGRQQAKMV